MARVEPLTRLIYGAKPLTGHPLPATVPVVVVHLPFGMGLTPFSWRVRRALFFTPSALEDFLVRVQPGVRRKRFKPEISAACAGLDLDHAARLLIFIPVGLSIG